MGAGHFFRVNFLSGVQDISLLPFAVILGDPGADSGSRESRNGQKKKKKKLAKKSCAHFFFALSDFPSPHYLPLGPGGCFAVCIFLLQKLCRNFHAN